MKWCQCCNSFNCCKNCKCCKCCKKRPNWMPDRTYWGALKDCFKSVWKLFRKHCACYYCSNCQNVRRIRKSHLPIVWVLGGPGAGKSTQCVKLAACYQLKIISIYELLRAEAMKSGSILAKKISDRLDKGELPSREVVFRLLKKAMALDTDWAKGYLVDDFPRDIQSGECFEKEIGPCSLILYFKCTDLTMEARYLDRDPGVYDPIETNFYQRLDMFYVFSEPIIFHYSSKVAVIEADENAYYTYLQCQNKLDDIFLPNVSNQFSLSNRYAPDFVRNDQRFKQQQSIDLTA